MLPFNFDPPLPRGKKPRKSHPTASPALTVTQLATSIKAALADAFPQRVRVIGQVTGFSNRSSGGHWFFNLKDEQASMRCVCFASSARKVTFEVKDGLEVILTGRVDYFEGQGSLQLYVDKIEPVGIGELELRFRALCEELRKLGYFEGTRKKPLPVFAQRIAVVTSRGAAALQDVINTTHKRWPGCELYLFHVPVQGETAAPRIACALQWLSQHGKKIGLDAIILTRGGGSIEDLWAFNEREVADAVFECTLPIVAAIGHETDTTVAELVADLRCATPTQAAMTLVPDADAYRQQLGQLTQRLALLLRKQLQHSRQRLDAAARHPALRSPEKALAPLREKIERCEHTLRLVLPRLAAARREKLLSLSLRLEAVSPRNVLKRGYTYTLGPDGKVIRSALSLEGGQKIDTVFADGQVRSTVDAQRTHGKHRPTGTGKADDPRQGGGGLFGH
ncbi:MAG: exodeoxyribonuclease VII large subunit [Phycisphaera sp.]|nr:exodeoxyribonuclease VII large subunit [Phycisphaera sp.]